MDATPLTPHHRDVPLPKWSVQAHRRDSRAVVFTCDGDQVITAGDDPQIRIWDAEDGALLRTLPGHKRGGECLAIHPDGWRLLSGGRDKVARVWALDTGKQLMTLEGHDRAVTAVAISRDGMFAATGDGNHTIKVWAIDSGEVVHTWEGRTDPVRHLSFDVVDGLPWIWSACDGGHVLGGALGDAKPQIKQHGRRIICMDAKGDLAIVTDPKGGSAHAPQATLYRFDRAGVGRANYRLEGHIGEVRCAGFSRQGYVITGSADRGLRVFAAAGTVDLHLRAGGAGCDHLDVDTQNGHLAVGDSDGRLLVFCRTVFDINDPHPAHNHAISAVGFDHGGRPWSIGRDGRLVIRNDALEVTETHELRSVPSLHTSAGFIGGAWSGETPLTLSSASTYGLERWEMLNRPSVEKHRAIDGASANCMAAGPSRIAIGVLDRTVRILDTASLDELHRIELNGYPEAVAIGPDGMVAVADEGGVLQRIGLDGSIETQAEIRVRALSFGADGTLFVGRSDGIVRALPSDGGAAIGHKAHDGVVVALASTGDTLFSAGRDRRLIRWGLGAAGLVVEETWTLPVPVQALAIRGGMLVYGDAAGAMGRWDFGA